MREKERERGKWVKGKRQEEFKEGGKTEEEKRKRFERKKKEN